ncbi:hypothetical protein ACFPVX_10465 [Cohnella faecalis]|uniref:hypothetical protein n=1 Tax=Cohnella faecalis TaxID=2315694 RepID=UPI0011C20F80|nr:hypothetical protein [Cohnella faecalis]
MLPVIIQEKKQSNKNKDCRVKYKLIVHYFHEYLFQAYFQFEYVIRVSINHDIRRFLQFNRFAWSSGLPPVNRFERRNPFPARLLRQSRPKRKAKEIIEQKQKRKMGRLGW